MLVRVRRDPPVTIGGANNPETGEVAPLRCQGPGFVEGGLSGAGGCRLGLVGGGLLTDILGVGGGVADGGGVGVVWWGVCLLVLDRGAHADGGARPGVARPVAPTQQWRAPRPRCPARAHAR